MKTSKLLLLISCVGLLLVAFAPVAKASEMDKLTLITVREPIMVPGRVVLQPGEYTMKEPAPNVVEITNRRGDRVYATFFGNSIERSKVTDNTVFTFREVPKGEALPLHAWFYPGWITGVEFPTPR